MLLTLRKPKAAEPVSAPTRPLVIAHRGASYDFAEHTFHAYIAAIAAGVDGLEADVRLTKDAQLVCMHDRTVSRTSDGDGAVADYTLEELHELDFSSWHPRHPQSRARVLPLRSLLELVRDSPRQVDLYLETKHPTRFGGLLEKTLVELLDEFGWAGTPRHPYSPGAECDFSNRASIMSFNANAIRRVKLMAPDIPTVQLIDHFILHRPGGVLPRGVRIAGPRLEVLRKKPSYVERAHALGNRVYVWTVDKPEDIEFVRELGVDAIITNRPADVLKQLG